jgi:hypothetical protein
MTDMKALVTGVTEEGRGIGLANKVRPYTPTQPEEAGP